MENRTTIQITEELEAYVKMTLTAPNCPVAGSLPIAVKQQIQRVA